jgi:hypothetical protein
MLAGEDTMRSIHRLSPHVPARVLVLAFVLALGGCYGSGRARGAANAAWSGRTRASIEARWGQPTAVEAQGSATLLRWSHTRRYVDLPAFQAELTVKPGYVEGMAAVRPGAVWHSTTEVVALVDGRGIVTTVSGASMRWGGPPNDANLRWGGIMGLHAGMGRLDDTSTALPSGGFYIGGMLGPRHGLVGTFSLNSGKDDAGGAMGFAWGIAPVWWPLTRVSVRGGPALVLAFDPGFDDPVLTVGLNGSASYALVKAGTFVLDLRVDLTAAASVTFGNVGIGVNVN